MAVRPRVAIEERQQGRTATLEVGELFTAALLKVCGVRLIDIVQAGSGRACFIFDDQDGRARGLVREHRNEGVSVNSAAYALAVDWAKTQVFAVRDGR